MIAALFLFHSSNSFFSFLVIGTIKFSCDLLSSYKNGLRIPILQNNLEKDEVSSAFGQLQSIGALLEIFTQTVGVALLSITGQSFVIIALINSLLYFLSSAALFIFKKHLTHKKIKTFSKKVDMKETLSEIKQVFSTKDGNDNFIALIGSIVLINFILSSIGPLTDLSLITSLPFGGNYGLNVLIFNSFLTVGMIAGSLFMKDIFKKFDMTGLIIIVFTFSVLFCISLNLFSIIAPIFLFMIAYCASKTTPRVNSLIFDNVAPENLGKVSGGISTIFTFSAPFGASFFIFIANLISVSVTFYIISIISILSITFLTFSKREMKWKREVKK